MSARVNYGDPLTSREIEVLALVTRGSSNKEIAEILGIGASSVRSHMSNLQRKLGAATAKDASLRWTFAPQRLDEAAASLHVAHGRLSREGWRRVVGLVVDELLEDPSVEGGEGVMLK